MIVNTFKGKPRAKYAAFDTETRVLIDGVALTDAQIRQMCAQTRTVAGEKVPRYPVSWWREHAEVQCWAYIVYTPDGFAIAETWEEFVSLITTLRIRVGWWYYAPFDYAVLDHQLLSNGFRQMDRHATEPSTFSELSSDFGARYSLEICFPYTPRKGERSKIDRWKVKFYDLRNIFAGGLANLLKSFDVRNGDGESIRKLQMDYQTATGTADDIAYMRADAEGLWWLIQKASAYMEENYSISIRNGAPEVLTASGLAKKVYLRERYPDERNDGARIRRYHREHPMTIEQDLLLRERGLLEGGIVMVNPHIKGKHLRGLRAYRADVNSEYPFIMTKIREIYDPPDVFKSVGEAKAQYGRSACIVLEFSQISATLRSGMIPSWRHPITGKLESEIAITRGDTHRFCIFLEEFAELAKWYRMNSFMISNVYAWKTREDPALGNVMRREYARKTEAKKERDAVKSYFSKLIMNGLGGKFSQNPRHIRTERVMEDGIVKNQGIIRKGEAVVDVDAKAIMHVGQGAWITCGGRCYLRRLAREICAGEVARKLFYTDTDSLHTSVKPPAHLVDQDRLGALKIENSSPITGACFLAPKTYYEIADITEIHAKGVKTEAIQALIKRGVPIEKIYTPGFRILSESSLNVRGGKAILPLPKQLCRVTDANNIDE